MLGAFFIITDPVSSAVSNKGRIIYGAAIGVLVYIIRYWGNYPDAIAFAVLLMNFARALEEKKSNTTWADPISKAQFLSSSSLDCDNEANRRGARSEFLLEGSDLIIQ